MNEELQLTRLERSAKIKGPLGGFSYNLSLYILKDSSNIESNLYRITGGRYGKSA